MIDVDSEPPAERRTIGELAADDSWLTIATGVESAVSASEKSRPAICGMLNVVKKFGVTGRTWLDGSCPSAGRG